MASSEKAHKHFFKVFFFFNLFFTVPVVFATCELLIVVIPLVVEHGLYRAGELQQLLDTGFTTPCLWDLPGPGIEPGSLALAGGVITTGPPKSSPKYSFIQKSILYCKFLGDQWVLLHPFLCSVALATIKYFCKWWCLPIGKFFYMFTFLSALIHIFNEYILTFTTLTIC